MANELIVKTSQMSYCAENALMMAYISKFCYFDTRNGDPDETKILKKLKNLDTGFREVQGFSASSSQGCVIEHDEYLVVVFRGTDEIADWLDNINVAPKKTPFGKVHRGFYLALHDIWAQMRRAIVRFQKPLDSNKPIFLTGHSLGGALATLGAAEMANNDEPFYGVYTFGSPRCGKRRFEEKYKIAAQARTFRFVNNADLVTRMPARIMNYRHVGNLVYISNEGKLSMNLGFWYRFIDTVTAVAADIGKKGLEGIEDHKMNHYIKAIKKWGLKEPDNS